MRILFTHLLPIIGSIRAIKCDNDECMEFLERHFPDILAQAKELDLKLIAGPAPAFIPACLNWLNAPLDFDVHGPRLLKIEADSDFSTIIAIVNIVSQVEYF